MIMEKLLTVEEVAALIGFSAFNVRKFCRLKQLPHVKLGGRFRFSRKIVEDWVEKQHEKSVVITKPVLIKKIMYA